MKDERILILKTGINKPSCDCLMLEGCTVDDSCACCSVGIPYSEAIEKMVRAMCCLEGNCRQCPYQNNENMCKEFLTIPANCGYNYYELADAALKALLEDNK